ncbi:hypothetical protein E4T16_14700 [Vibrio parahaemolyticus]|nr:hypothetical protein [Vibrio parahaemolyticus]EGR0686855.1 hypothetical protein [Vibrio parahaemolyticus]
MTFTDLEERLIPIRIPPFKGFLGNRLFIINKSDESKFDNMSEDVNVFMQIESGYVGEGGSGATLVACDTFIA